MHITKSTGFPIHNPVFKLHIKLETPWCKSGSWPAAMTIVSQASLKLKCSKFDALHHFAQPE